MVSDTQRCSVQNVGLVMLGVRDLERSIPFYRDSLGLKLQSQGGGFAFFDGGGVTLALSQELGRARDYKTGAVEVVFSVADVRTAHEALTGRGVNFQRPPRVVTGQQWSANFTDPDGHELSIFGPSSTPSPGQ
jgi:catechol 2,3-dioxygenase-like lactoylglutathione lyase family enzyme